MKNRYHGSKNSFVTPNANYEYHIDLLVITDLEKKQKYKIGMACIAIFTKYATVVPILSKHIPDFLAGLMECLKNMKSKPMFIYSDEEGALTSNDIQAYLKKETIEVIMTRIHAHFVERCIRTFKMMLRKRIDDDMQQGKEVQWYSYICPILLTYNNKNEHSTVGITPNEATKKRIN